MVGRLPVFIPAADGTDRFWGFTAVLIRISELINAASLQKIIDAGYHYELSRMHPDTGERDIFARSVETALHSPTHYTIDVPNGTWTLSVEPVGGWFSPLVISGEITLVLLISVLIISLWHPSCLGVLRRQDINAKRPNCGNYGDRFIKYKTEADIFKKADSRDK